MNSSNSVSGASPSIAPPTRSFLVLLADGTRHRVTCGELAVQLRQERSAALKRLRQGRAEALAAVADRVADARIRREFEACERAMDAAIRRLSKQVRVKPEKKRHAPAKRQSSTKPRSSGHGGLVLANRRQRPSALARRDRLGREGIMLRIRYVRAGGKHAAPGCLRRHWFYIAREAAVTLDSEGNPILLGSLGATPEEIADGLDLQEQLLRAMRKNAKLSFRMIGAFPYGLPVDARREVLQRIGDGIFGARGLPWTGAAHDADAAAKVDNPHFHLDYAALPMTRQPDGSYIVSNDLRTDLDGQEGLRFIRHMVAQIMTEVAQEYGLDRSFTALSYRERGMDREGGEHVGQEGTAAHRRGEHVAAIERNEARRLLGERCESARNARERLEALERLKRAIAAEAGAPSLAMIPADVMLEAFIDEPMAPALPDGLDGAQSVQTSPAPRLPRSAETFVALAAAAPDINSASTMPFAEAQEALAMSAPVPSNIDVADQAIPVAAVPLLYDITPIATQIGSPPTLIPVGQPAPSLQHSNRLFATSAEAPRFETPLTATDLPRVTEMATITAVVSNIGAATPSMTDVPTMTDTVNLITTPILPMPGEITIVMLPTEAPSMTPGPANASTSVPTAPAIGASTASLTHISGSAPSMSAPPVVPGIGAVAPTIAALPPLFITEDEAPRLVRVEALHAISAAGHRVDALPALVALGESLTTVERVPPISAIGQAARRMPRMELAIWKVGQAVAKDVVDDATERRLQEAATSVSERSVAESRIALDHLLWAIREERHYLAAENGGRVVEPDLLARFGLTRDDIASLDVQQRLQTIVAKQSTELSQIATYVRGSPNMVVKIRDHWVLADTAPEDMQRLVIAWRDDRRMQNALARVAATVSKQDTAQHSEKAARRMPGTELAIGKVGQAVAKDVVADATERRLQEAASRISERSVAESRIALDHLLWAIREERHYLAAENGGRVVEPDLLARFGLTRDDIASLDVQQRLQTIVAKQSTELSQIATYVRGSPNMVVKIRDHWVLADTASEDMQRLVIAWRDDRRMQNALARVAATVPKQDAAQHSEKAAPRDEAGAAWMRARHFRDRAMAKWDELERLDRLGMERPGEPLARPGQATAEGAPSIARRFPGIQGPGLGD